MQKTQLKELLIKDARQVLPLIKEGDGRRSIIALLWECALQEGEAKEIRKSAKKALYMARSRGIDVDQYRPKRREPLTEKLPQTSVHSSLLTPPDSEGSNLLAIDTFNQKTQAFHFFVFLIHPERGVEEFSLNHGSKKDLERVKEQNQELFSIPVDCARYRLKKALERTDVKRISGLSTLPDELKWEADHEVAHPVLELIPTQVARIHAPSEETKTLGMREVARLSLFQEDTKEYKSAIEDAQQSRLILENKSPQERIEDIVERFFSTYFTPEKKALYREMLLDVALFYSSQGLQDHARILVDYAQALMASYLDPRKHPFLRFLVYKEFFGEE